MMDHDDDSATIARRKSHCELQRSYGISDLTIETRCADFNGRAYSVRALDFLVRRVLV
jgi:hypothetical protein